MKVGFCGGGDDFGESRFTTARRAPKNHGERMARINHPVDDFPLPDQVALAKKFAESLGAKGIGEVHAGWIVYPTNDCVNSNCKVLLDALPKESGATKVEV